MKENESVWLAGFVGGAAVSTFAWIWHDLFPTSYGLVSALLIGVTVVVYALPPASRAGKKKPPKK